jgi:hypothetical protein
MEEIQRLRQGESRGTIFVLSSVVVDATVGRKSFARRRLPTGGAAQLWSVALERKSWGVKWPACQQELERNQGWCFQPRTRLSSFSVEKRKKRSLIANTVKDMILSGEVCAE